jgi:Fe-S cluster assembly protein SufD
MSAESFTAALINQRPEIEQEVPWGNLPTISRMREIAHDRLKNRGFPTARDEEWRYTDLRKLQKMVFSIGGADDGEPGVLLEKTQLAPSAKYCMVFVNGVFSESLTHIPQLPDGITIQPLAAALCDDTTILQKYLGTALPEEPHGFTSANSAYFRDGAFIRLGRDAVLDAPMELVFITSSGSPRVAHPRNLVLCEPNSSATIIERHISSEGQPCLNNPVTEIFADDGASLDHYKIQDEQAQGFHTGGLFIRQQRSSHVTSNNIALGSLLARTDLICSLDGPGAHIEMNGIVIGGGRQHIDNCTEVVHAAPSCTSDEFYKSVLDDRSRSVFRGRIVVAEDAQQTDANQQSRNLLLSSGSEADVKPQLEIYADDVKCAHGATVGQLDADATYYLRSRGLDEASARSLLTFAFANEVIERVPLAGIRAQLSQHLAGRLLPDLGAESIL